VNPYRGTAHAKFSGSRPFRVDAGGRTAILNHMVYYSHAPLDRTFAALSDPTRRAILMRLADQDTMSVSQLAEPFPMSLPAIMKHLDVLSEAGLVTRTKTGRTVACRLSAGPMEEAMHWLAHYQRFWSSALDRLAAFVEEKECLPSPASPSPAASRRRRRKSSPHGRTRKN
jgi:DNA-binding transcriptional ArsR family regulator